MTEEEIAIALTPFGQVDGSRTRWREGTGLGLPIAKALVELHGGRLEIKQRQGRRHRRSRCSCRRAITCRQSTSSETANAFR